MRENKLKGLFTSILMSMLAIGLHAQDTMITQDGDVKTVYVVDIGSTAVFYKAENTDVAAIQSISKDQIFMIKRADGTKYDLGNASTLAAQSETSTQSSMPQLSNEVSEEAMQRNKEVIENINSYVPEYVGKVGKECNRVFCVMGIGEGSCMVNDEVELSMEIVPPPQKESFNRNVQYSYANPLLLLTVKNKTTNTLYIDLGNTFFMRGGENATAYYVPSATSTASTNSSGVSVNAGAVAGALGIGGGLGKLAGGVNVGGGSSSTSVNVTYSQRVVAIPPMSSKTLDGQPLFCEEGWFCDGLKIVDYAKNAPKLPWFFFRAEKNDPEFENGAVHSYSEELSPVHFSVFLTYSYTEDSSASKRISSSFYIKDIIGIHHGYGGGTSLNNCYVQHDIPKCDDCIYFVGLNADGRLYYKSVPSVFPRP